MQILRATYLSLGSNQGNKLENLQQAVDLIAEKIGIISKISSIYKTAAWGFESNDFYNICLQVSTGLNPENLLKTITEIELLLGRKRTFEKEYKARTIDIDILFFDNEIIFSKNLLMMKSFFFPAFFRVIIKITVIKSNCFNYIIFIRIGNVIIIYISTNTNYSI